MKLTGWKFSAAENISFYAEIVGGEMPWLGHFRGMNRSDGNYDRIDIPRQEFQSSFIF